MYDEKTITICFAPWLLQSFMYTKETENANRFTILYCPLASMLATLNCKGKTYTVTFTNICCTGTLLWHWFWTFKIKITALRGRFHAIFIHAKQCLSSFNLDLLEACPVIGPHLQETTNYHAQPDATPVTKQDVQNDLIPPAFSKIRQKVHEEEL